MRRYALTLLAAAAVGVAVSQSATAADLGRPVYKAPPPPPPPVSDWSGIYVGLEGGYGWGDQNTDPTFPGHVDPTNCAPSNGGGPFFCNIIFPIVGDPEFNLLENFRPSSDPAVALGKIKTNGGLFGGFFGAQKQWGSWVLGIEGDVDWADMKGTVEGSNATHVGFGGGVFDPVDRSQSVSMTAKVDMLASLRGKVGWSFAPDWLIYGTGGAAFARVRDTIDQTASVTFCDEFYNAAGVCTGAGAFSRIVSGSSSLNGTGDTTMFGWAAGAGIDWKWQLDPGSALVLGVEYLHYDFPGQTITVADSGGNSFSFEAKQHVDSVKGRISYLFSIH